MHNGLDAKTAVLNVLLVVHAEQSQNGSNNDLTSLMRRLQLFFLKSKSMAVSMYWEPSPVVGRGLVKSIPTSLQRELIVQKQIRFHFQFGFTVYLN